MESAKRNTLNSVRTFSDRSGLFPTVKVVPSLYLGIHRRVWASSWERRRTERGKRPPIGSDPLGRRQVLKHSGYRVTTIGAISERTTTQNPRQPFYFSKIMQDAFRMHWND